MSAPKTVEEDGEGSTGGSGEGGKEEGVMEFSKVLISGAGFLADAYDLFVINVAVDLMGKNSYHEELTNNMKSNIKTMALVGAVVGQLGFGAVADLIGRKRVFVMTCVLVIIGAILSAVAVDNEFGIYRQLCIFRFILGVGVGGEYPLSASITSESSTPKTKTRNLAMVFSMQGFGTVLCSVVLVILTHVLGDDYNLQWRLALGIGAAPMIVAFYFRWKMHETDWKIEAQVIEQKVIHDHHLEDHQHTRWSRAVQHFKEGYYFIKETVYQHRWRLLGTAGAWFILDVAFYANSLFSGQVTTSLGVAKTPQGEALASLFLQLIALPGYICTIFFIEKIGIIRLQLMGFFATGVFCIIIGGAQPDLVNLPALYIILYGLTFFFQNFGANATTYIVPSLAYPTSQRSTCHGMSAAAGKLGAILGAETFLYIADCYCHGDVCGKNADKELVNRGLRVTFFVCGAIAWSGLGWTYLFLPEDVVQGEHTTSYEALEPGTDLNVSTKTEAENKQTNNETLAIEMKTLEVALHVLRQDGASTPFTGGFRVESFLLLGQIGGLAEIWFN
eukprot:gene1339-1461_t